MKVERPIFMTSIRPMNLSKWVSPAICRIAFMALITSLTLPGLAHAQSVGAFSGFKSGNKSPIQIEADHLKVYDSKAVAIFRGNVKVVQGESLLKTDKLKVFYENKGKVKKGASQGNSIKRLEVYGTVYVRSKDNEATSDEGTFHMKTEDVELIGNVVLTQGKSIMTGCKFSANLKTGVATMESRCGQKKNSKPGRVKMLFEPQSAKKK
jgi:lipopolysaccharide export system protein LptA